MSELMKSFEPTSEQKAAHEVSATEISRIAEEMKKRVLAIVEAAFAKAAEEVNEQLNEEINGMIEEQLEMKKAA